MRDGFWDSQPEAKKVWDAYINEAFWDFNKNMLMSMSRQIAEENIKNGCEPAEMMLSEAYIYLLDNSLLKPFKCHEKDCDNRANEAPGWCKKHSVTNNAQR